MVLRFRNFSVNPRSKCRDRSLPLPSSNWQEAPQIPVRSSLVSQVLLCRPVLGMYIFTTLCDQKQLIGTNMSFIRLKYAVTCHRAGHPELCCALRSGDESAHPQPGMRVGQGWHPHKRGGTLVRTLQGDIRPASALTLPRSYFGRGTPGYFLNRLQRDYSCALLACMG